MTGHWYEAKKTFNISPVLHIVKDENELIFVRHVGVESTTKDQDLSFFNWFKINFNAAFSISCINSSQIVADKYETFPFL
jgi:hypothetical protein